MRKFHEIEPELTDGIPIFPSTYGRPANHPDAMERCKIRAKALYLFRRKREQFFPKGIFADPAWDILLDLYAAELEGKKVSITSACLASGVAQTTALRWIRVLEENDLIFRIHDAMDGRRSFLRITGHALSKISKLIMDSSFS